MAKPIRSTRAPTPRAKINAGDAARTPVPHRYWQRSFLTALAETSNVSAAAVAAKVSPSRPYKLKRHDSEFAREWRQALCEGYDHLELELLHRLRFGEPKDADAKFDNANALRLLTQHRETVARERAIRENADIAEVRASIHAKLLEMRDQVLARRKADHLAADADVPHG